MTDLHEEPLKAEAQSSAAEPGAAPPQRDARRKGTAQSRWCWSGVAEIVQPQHLDEILTSVVGLLPSPKSPVEQIVAEIRYLGGRYHRYLHQDEFGPTRAQQMAALRKLRDQLELLASRLTGLPQHLRFRLSEEFAQCGPCQAISYLDEAPMERIYEAAVDVGRRLEQAGAAGDAKLMADLGETAKNTLLMLLAVDTTTEGEAVIETGLVGLDGTGSPEDNADPFSSLCARVLNVYRRFKLTLDRLEGQKGPQIRTSLPLLVCQLCDLWCRETGRPVTSSAVRGGTYTGRPQSPSAQFVLRAAQALRPSAAWRQEHEAWGEPMRASLITTPGSHMDGPILTAMRQYVAAQPASEVRRGRRRRPKVTL